MSHAYKPPTMKGNALLALGLGIGFSVILFAGMALAQIMDTLRPPEDEFDSFEISMAPPEMEEIEDEPPPPPPPEEEPPELEEPPPPISLDMLDAALNVGSGGEGGFDIGLPGMDAGEAGNLDIKDFFDIEDLDKQPGFTAGGDPGPLFASLLKKDRSLRSKFLTRAADWSVTVYFKVDRNGNVVEVSRIESTESALENAAREAVMNSKPEPGTRAGEPVGYIGKYPFVKRGQ